ncbi:class I SAM-dependent methyltransferase [bacterium]|nr:class I SAM-dependent methyltransferase [bacterium]
MTGGESNAARRDALPAEGTSCAACGASATTADALPVADYEYGVEPARPFAFARCPECGSERLTPTPTEAELLSFYPPGYHAYNDDHGAVATLLVGIRARLRARAYAALVGGRPGALYDVGAGDCRHFTELLRYHPFTCAGIEINPRMAEQGRARGFDVESGTLERADLTRHLGRYDIVSMNHVLEHVIDPGEVTRRAFQLLRPGGHLVGQLPTNSSWEARAFGPYWAGYHFPRHLHVFSRAGLTRLLQRVGFVDIRIRSTPHIQIPLSLQNALVGRGWNLRLRFGRARLFGPLLLASLPLEVVQASCGRSGVVDFQATRPAGPAA